MPKKTSADKPLYEHTQYIFAQDRSVKSVEYLWKPFIPYGALSLLQGDGGCGKSSLCIMLAAMVTAGIVPPEIQHGQFLEAKKTKPKRVFYATSENDFDRTSLPRFIRNGGDVKHFVSSEESLFHFTIDGDELRYVINDLKPSLVIIDPIQSFLPRGVSMGNQVAMRYVLNEAHNIASETNTAILFVGHITKSEYAKINHLGFGSADLYNIMRSVLYCEEQENEPEDAPRTVIQIKSNYDDSYRRPFYISMGEDKKLALLGSLDQFEEVNEVNYTKADMAKEFIKEMLNHGSVESGKIIAEAAEKGISRSTLYRAKRELGVIDKNEIWTL